jgi:hypothetical protein
MSCIIRREQEKFNFHANLKYLDPTCEIMPFTEDNPYVKDDMYFANRTHYIYAETTEYLMQITYNCVCFALGTFLFLLICYLLHSQTPPNLKSYRVMLLLATLVDIFVLVNCLGVQYVSQNFQLILKAREFCSAHVRTMV